MTDLSLRTLDGASKKISPDTVTALRSGLRGTVVFPERTATIRPEPFGTP